VTRWASEPWARITQMSTCPSEFILVNAILCPLGENAGAPLSLPGGVSRRTWEPSGRMVKTLLPPPRSLWKAITPFPPENAACAVGGDAASTARESAPAEIAAREDDRAFTTRLGYRPHVRRRTRVQLMRLRVSRA
jgi:hypothetical protein